MNEKQGGWASRSLLTLSHPVLQITEKATPWVKKEIENYEDIRKTLQVRARVLYTLIVARSLPVPRVVITIIQTRLAARVVRRSVMCHARLHVVNQSTHSKCAGSSANHSSLVKRRGSPSITQRIFGKYGPSVVRANMRVFTDLWTFMPRRITRWYTFRPFPRFQLTANVINDTACRR